LEKRFYKKTPGCIKKKILWQSACIRRRCGSSGAKRPAERTTGNKRWKNRKENIKRSVKLAVEEFDAEDIGGKGKESMQPKSGRRTQRWKAVEAGMDEMFAWAACMGWYCGMGRTDAAGRTDPMR
jgi:hypothetical protein